MRKLTQYEIMIIFILIFLVLIAVLLFINPFCQECKVILTECCEESKGCSGEYCSVSKSCYPYIENTCEGEIR